LDTDGGNTFLSANLDFTAEPSLQALKDVGRIASHKIVWRGSEQICIIGLTTPELPFISSPRNVVVDDRLAAIVQEHVGILESQGLV